MKEDSILSQSKDKASVRPAHISRKLFLLIKFKKEHLNY